MAVVPVPVQVPSTPGTLEPASLPLRNTPSDSVKSTPDTVIAEITLSNKSSSN